MLNKWPQGYNLNRLGKDDYNCNIRDRSKEKLQIERPNIYLEFGAASE